jgi:pyruvate decarboxylase
VCQQVGSVNELNAAYAADAYARVRGRIFQPELSFDTQANVADKRVAGLGALLTTFGVGELSAVNAIAGSFAELAPVVHIVGTPNRAIQAQGAMLHHTLGNGDYRVFAKIYSNITVAQADLKDPETAAAQIDRALQACWVESKPVYIELPVDMVTKNIDAALLDIPITLSKQTSDKDAEDMVIDILLERLYGAKKPVFLVDGAAQRRKVMPAAHKLLAKLKLPVFVAPMGKGAVNESLPYFAGIYSGDGSKPEIKAAIEGSDLVITIGNIKSDLNTSFFSYSFSRLNTVDLHYDHAEIGYATFDKVSFHSLVPRLTDVVDPAKLKPEAQIMPTPTTPPSVASHYGGDVITHEWLWPRISSYLNENDIVVADTGTAYIGMWDVQLPDNVQIISQILWSSIGYGCPAAQGAALAARDGGNRQRVICFEGDGSFQLTAQELSVIIHHELDVTMFLIENEGYTIVSLARGHTRLVWKDVLSRDAGTNGAHRAFRGHV